MFIMHIALGGCLRPPPVRYGLTEDTGGHIAYVLGAAAAMAAHAATSRVQIVTRLFHDAGLGAIHARPRERAAAGYEIVRLPTRSPGYLDKAALTADLPSFIEALLAHVAGLDRAPDVIHAHFADAAEAALALRARSGGRVIYTPHSLAVDKVGGNGGTGGDGALAARLARERRALRDSDAIVVSSRDEAERQIAAYGLVTAPVFQISPGIDIPAVHDKACGNRMKTAEAEALLAPFLRAPERPLILAIARPVAKKNLSALLEAYATTPGLRDRANLAILAGLRDDPASGTEEQRAVIGDLLHRIDRHDLYGHVALPKRHDRETVAQIYRLAAARRGIFVNPACFEPFGLTLIEAAAAGLPVVATRVGGPVDIVGALCNGRLCDPADPADIGHAIAGLLDDPAAWARAAQNGLDGAAGYSWTSYADRFLRRAHTLAAPPRRTAQRPQAMFVSDIDNTLTGCAAGARRVRDWLARTPVPFVVASGRSLAEARRVLDDWGLPDPEVFITSVGTEIHRIRGRRCVPDFGFTAHISTGWDADAIAACLAGLSGLVPQAAIEQRAFKRSFFGDASAVARARRALTKAGLAARLVHSHGDLIDVIPMRAGKAAAAAWVADSMGLGLADCIAAGDSGNDIDLLERAGCAIVVANAGAELDALAARPGVLRARLSHGAGVVEGLHHFLAEAAPRSATAPVRAA